MYRFHIELPDDLWEKFKTRAIQEHGSPRQAALLLFRRYIGQDSERDEKRSADDIDVQAKRKATP